MKEHLELLKEELADSDAQLFDVREFEEWKLGHLTNALFVPLSELKTGKLPLNINKQKKTYLHCRSGNRVHPAKELLKAMGFKNIVTLSEGFEELANTGLPTEAEK